ncbi:EF-hand domain-containing protein [Sphingomonas tabacisoli]|uniref:EF-hand domain-containing protein n=1 Tax=Sphingomonas tabacisoli TaxID=2249466 RepID=A0ABW4I5H0_9SPHN
MATALVVSALGALALTSGIALAAGQPQDMRDHPMGDMTRAQVIEMANKHFDRLDVNHDGKLDRADREAMHAKMAAEMFDRADTNHDGMISREEWNAGAARLAEMRGHDGAMGGPGMQGRPMMRHMAMMADADGDHAITREEFQKRALEHFDRVDTNHDGKISAEEREQAHAAMRERFERK